MIHLLPILLCLNNRFSQSYSLTPQHPLTNNKTLFFGLTWLLTPVPEIVLLWPDTAIYTVSPLLEAQASWLKERLTGLHLHPNVTYSLKNYFWFIHKFKIFENYFCVQIYTINPAIPPLIQMNKVNEVKGFNGMLEHNQLTL